MHHHCEELHLGNIPHLISFLFLIPNPESEVLVDNICILLLLKVCDFALILLTELLN